MKTKFAVIIEKGRKNYKATISGLAGCYVKSKTLDALISGVRKEIKLNLRNEKDCITSTFVAVNIMNFGAGKKFTVVVEKGMKYYTARVPSLPGCHTQAQTLPELSKYLREAIKLHFMLKQRIEKSDFIGVQVIEV